MASTFHFFRDTLQINLDTIRALNAPGGATIVFGARSITLSELISGYSYVIAADELKVPSGVVAIQNSDAITPASVTVLAQKIDGALRVSVAGVAGEAGANGEPGESASSRAIRQAVSRWFCLVGTVATAGMVRMAGPAGI